MDFLIDLLKNVCSLQIQSICEKGLQVGHSKITVLGNPSMGNYRLGVCAGVAQCELADNAMRLGKLAVLFL